jgi:hypothetical protein
LLGFDFRVLQYKLGASNVVTDALSRHDTNEGTRKWPYQHLPFGCLTISVRTLPIQSTLKSKVVSGDHNDKWYLINDLITVNRWMYVLPTSPTVPVILVDAYNLDHEGVEKVLHYLRADFHVLKASSMVQDNVQACEVC